MTRATPTRPPLPRARISTVGVDVGGERKGFHAVALSDGAYSSHLATTNAQELARWCRETVQASAIAVDAPCAWSTDGYARPAERALMRAGIHCFSTPTRATALERKRRHALGQATDYFGWMLRGEALFDALVKDFPLCRHLPATGHKCCFETFPYAITWHLRGGNADARQKGTQRRELLAQAGLDATHLTNIDWADAALCALAAYHVATGAACTSFGEPNTGLIIVPSRLRS